MAVVVQFEFGSLDKPSFVRPQAFLVLQHAQWVQSISPKGLKHLLWHLWYQFFSLIRYFSPKIGKKGVKFVSAEANSPPVSIYCSPEKWLSSLTLQLYWKSGSDALHPLFARYITQITKVSKSVLKSYQFFIWALSHLLRVFFMTFRVMMLNH